MTKIHIRIAGFAFKCFARPARWAAVCLLPVAAAADVPAVQLSSTLKFDRGVQMTWDAGTLDSSLRNAASLLTTAKAVTIFTDRARLTYGADLILTGNGLATTNDATEVEGGLSLNYQRQFGSANEWQYQLRGEVDRLVSDKQMVFQRERVGLHLRYRHNPTHSTAGSLRIGYRDQNDDRLTGYDQTEVLGQITHTWRPNRDRLAFAGTIYNETRRADLDRYSYDERGLRFMARAPMSKTTEITARVSYYQRDFLDAYSTTDPTRRNDTRLKAVIDVDYSFSDRVSGNIYAGWDGNVSTINEVAYDGATVGVGVTYQWR